MPAFEFRCNDCGGSFEVIRPQGASLDDVLCQWCTSRNIGLRDSSANYVSYHKCGLNHSPG